MPRTDLLLQLAEHLETGKLGHDKFDIECFHEVQMCGTAGCAIGECPVLWPREWQWEGSRARLRDHDLYGSVAARKFFGLTRDEADHLFYSEAQDPDRFGGNVLGGDATKEQVAANIRAFVDRCSLTIPGEEQL